MFDPQPNFDDYLNRQIDNYTATHYVCEKCDERIKNEDDVFVHVDGIYYCQDCYEEVCNDQ